jgi:hypothetical protein
LGNQFKFGSIIKQITYEQSRDGQAISQANSRTRAKFGNAKKAGLSKGIPGIGIPYTRQWYYDQKSKGAGRLPEISFGIIDPRQTRNLRIDERADSYEKITKETSGHLDHYISDHRHTPLSLLRGLAGLLDSVKNNEQVKRVKKKDEHKRRRMSR